MGFLRNLIKKLLGDNRLPETPIVKATVVSQITIQEEIQQALEKLEPYKRNAFLPITETVEPEFSAVDKMGGLPHLRHADDWPICPNCKIHMQLFLQLNLAQLPERKQQGLLQMFYCTTNEEDLLCEFDQEGYTPFSANAVIRIIDHNTPSVHITPNRNDLFKEKRIVSWTRIDDYPCYEDYHELGIELQLSEDAEELMFEQDMLITQQCDKLFGWPRWVQSPEYPYDRTTGKRMELLFQIDSDDNLPHRFGDVGTGHITQSPDNSSELAFAWACY